MASGPAVETRGPSSDLEPSWGNVLALAKALGVDCTAFDQEPAPRFTLRAWTPWQTKGRGAGPQAASWSAV